MWAPVEDWEEVGGSLDSTGKALQAVSSHLLNKAAGCCWYHGWIFIIALKTKMDSILRDATLVHNVQRHLEELEQSILALQQEPHGP